MITSAHKGLAVAAEKCRQQADTIDALVAALEASAMSAGFQYMTHETRNQIDAALALARKGG